MKSLLVALALLTGDTAWAETPTPLFGLVCPTLEGARIVANTPIAYSFATHVERGGCAFVVFEGRIVRETPMFNIGNELFTFREVSTEGRTVYLLTSYGEGYVT